MNHRQEVERLAASGKEELEKGDAAMQVQLGEKVMATVKHGEEKFQALVDRIRYGRSKVGMAVSSTQGGGEGLWQSAGEGGSNFGGLVLGGIEADFRK